MSVLLYLVIVCVCFKQLSPAFSLRCMGYVAFVRESQKRQEDLI